MKEVSKDIFWKIIGPQDVCAQIVGKYPYTSIFKTRNGHNEVGRIVDKTESGKVKSQYFLSE